MSLYEETRVRLEGKDEEDDYINANYIKICS